jgi:PncC family amidohydrolase
VPGASTVFVGGVIAYDDDIKVRTLGVPAEAIAAYGAVSEAVVRAMAAGAQARLGADAAIAVSGIAGPEGGSDEKPVGTVWLCAAWGAEQRAARIGIAGDRSEIRGRAAQAALDLLRRLLPPEPPAGR